MEATPAADSLQPIELVLPVGSVELHQMLLHGRIEHQGRAWLAQPQSMLATDDDRRADRVRVNLVAAPCAPRPASVALWLRAIRAISLTATLMPSVAILIYGGLRGWAASWWIAGSALLGVLSLQIAVNLMNDVEDHLRLIDLPGTLGGAGVIQQAWLSARTVRRVATGFLLAGVALGIPALLRAPVPLSIIGAVAVIGSIGSSGKPCGLKYRALGDIAVLAMCGPGLTLGFSLAAFGRVDAAVILLGGYFGFAAVAILHVNNLQDVAVDLEHGAVTVAAKLGPARSEKYLIALYVATFGSWIAACILEHLSPLALLVPLVGVLPVARFVHAFLGATSPSAPSVKLARVSAAQLHLALGVIMCVCLGLSRAFR